MQKITPFLWSDHQAEEAANYYVSVFRSNGGGSPVRAFSVKWLRFPSDVIRVRPEGY